MFKRSFSLILLSVFSIFLVAQNNSFPEDYFQPPIDGQLYLAGTFGELRSNHFHAGIDIKTGGSEGKKIYAIADGYVSRIKVSTGGYGKVVYITHPNGYVSVYGHLKKFNPDLEKYVNDIQYKRESFVMESYPEKGELTVKKGEVIALSGNTGGSSAPHLHFEIREEGSQHPVNPLLFKSISVKDFYRPKILELAIYPVDEFAEINGKNDTVFYQVGGWGDQHYLSSKPKITLSGNVAFGIRTYDVMNDIPNKNGVYKINFFIDTVQYFGLEMDKLSFATTRYLNSLIDYDYFQEKKRRLIRTQIDTNNRLFNYREVQSNGIVNFSDSLNHTIKYTVSDLYGNNSTLEFKVKGEETKLQENSERSIPEGTYFSFSEKNSLQLDGCSVSFPANSFYRSIYFQFNELPSDSTFYSPVYQLHNKYTPVQKSFTIDIKPDNFTEENKDKLYIAYLADNGGDWYIGSKWNGNKIQAKSKLLGKYVVMSDTIAPEIKPVNLIDGATISKNKSIKVKIKDGETGIRKYRGTLNGEWILMEYEPKKRLLEYKIDGHLKKGKNEFKLEVSDLLGNETVYEAELIY